MKKKLLSLMSLSLMASFANAQYCTDGGPSSNFDTNIDSVYIEGESSSVINFDDGCLSGVGVIDETALGVILNADGVTNYDLTVNWSTCGATTYGSRGSVWIDFNGSESFEESELIGDFEIDFGGTLTASTYSFTVPDDALNGTHRMRVIQQEGGTFPLDPCASFTYGSVHDFGVVIMGGVDCAGPGQLTASMITSNAATLSWVPGALESEWEVEYGEAPLTAGDGVTTIVTMGDTSLDVTGLLDNTDYDFFIRAICGVGDTSGANVGDFTTLCVPISVDDYFCEPFGAESSTANCWTTINANGDANEFDLEGELFGTPYDAALLNSNFSSSDDWLISPGLTISADQALKFDYRIFSSFYSQGIEVLLSTTGTAIADFTDTLVADTLIENTDYLTMGADLSTYDGETVYIAIHTSASLAWVLFIANFCVTPCTPEPSLDGTIDVCISDSTINASAAIVAGEDFGVWTYAPNNGLIDGETFAFTGLAEGVGTYELNYVVTTGCAIDSSVATINVIDTVSAGFDGTIEHCLNQPFNLLSGLSGPVNLGGFWTNEAGVELSSSAIVIAEAGVSTYSYNATNGVCANDVSDIIVTIDGDCDFLSLDENQLNALTVFPNPTSGVVSLSLNGTDEVFNYQVSDVTGRIILSETNAVNGNANTTVDFSSQESGIYLIRVFNENSEKVIRVVRN